MKFKTILTIALTAILTLVLVQNHEPILFKFLWLEFEISKVIALLLFFIAGLIVGLLWASSKSKNVESDASELSEEDREFLS